MALYRAVFRTLISLNMSLLTIFLISSPSYAQDNEPDRMVVYKWSWECTAKWLRSCYASDKFFYDDPRYNLCRYSIEDHSVNREIEPLTVQERPNGIIASRAVQGAAIDGTRGWFKSTVRVYFVRKDLNNGYKKLFGCKIDAQQPSDILYREFCKKSGVPNGYVATSAFFSRACDSSNGSMKWNMYRAAKLDSVKTKGTILQICIFQEVPAGWSQLSTIIGAGCDNRSSTGAKPNMRRIVKD